MSRELARRDVLAGFCAALALCFAPLERFVAGIEKMVARILGAPGTLVITGVDYEAGVLTLSDLSTVTVTSNDYAFQPGMGVELRGLSAWIPDTGTAARNFFGLRRSVPRSAVC